MEFDPYQLAGVLWGVAITMSNGAWAVYSRKTKHALEEQLRLQSRLEDEKKEEQKKLKEMLRQHESRHQEVDGKLADHEGLLMGIEESLTALDSFRGEMREDHRQVLSDLHRILTRLAIAHTPPE